MRLSLFSAALLCGTSAFAFAQDTSNLEKLSNFQTTGTAEFTFIDQTGEHPDRAYAGRSDPTRPPDERMSTSLHANDNALPAPGFVYAANSRDVAKGVIGGGGGSCGRGGLAFSVYAAGG